MYFRNGFHPSRRGLNLMSAHVADEMFRDTEAFALEQAIDDLEAETVESLGVSARWKAAYRRLLRRLFPWELEYIGGLMAR
jgi:hypothetical protein